VSLTKAQISILKKYVKKADNFRIAGLQSEQKVLFHLMVKESIRSKITKKYETTEHWLYMKVPCQLSESFVCQMTNDYAKENFLSFLSLTSGEFKIKMFFNNPCDWTEQIHIIVQTLKFEDTKNHQIVHTTFYPKEDHPYSLYSLHSSGDLRTNGNMYDKDPELGLELEVK